MHFFKLPGHVTLMHLKLTGIDEVDDSMGPFSMWLGSERARSSDLRERLPDSFFAEEEKDEDFEVDNDLRVVPIAEDDVEENRLRGEWVSEYHE
jgi:hypothetical protein